MSPANLFAREAATRERMEALVDRPGARIVRIWGPVAEPSEVYDQAEDEWVTLLAGAATLEIEGEAAPIELRPGDHRLIPAGQRHRVLRASADALWLAVHLLA